MTMFGRRTVFAVGLLAVGLAGCSNTEGPVSAGTTGGAPQKSTISAEAEAALQDLYATRPEARKLADNAKAILVFPSITKAGFGIGGLFGNGAMFEGGKTVGYYNIAGGSFGLQIGAQSFSQAYFFNTEEALKTFREDQRLRDRRRRVCGCRRLRRQWAVLDHTLQKPLVVATWGQTGLMAGIDVSGAKITETNP